MPPLKEDRLYSNNNLRGVFYILRWNDSPAIAEALAFMKKLRDLDSTIILLHHTEKNQ